MGLVSMKIPVNPESYQPSPYGWGLCINLSEEQVEALGLDENPPKAGSQVSVQAIATVMRVTEEIDNDEAGEGAEDADVDVCLTLQITDMSVAPSGAMSTSSMASSLYSGDND